LKKFKINENPMVFAIDLAKKAFLLNEVPIGCVIVNKEKEIISYAHNMTIQMKDPSAHAELLAIKLACKKLNVLKLIDCELYTTLEPCEMCQYLIIQTGIKKVYFGAYSDSIMKNKSKIKNNFLKKNEYYGGIKEKECSDLLKEFFSDLRS
jgi:tRNA(adenine34) deaminase